MMTEWKKVKLGELIHIKHGYAFEGKSISFDNNGIVLVTPGNFNIGGGFKEDKCKFFHSTYPKDYVLNADDLIVTMTDLSKDGDTLGYSALVPDSKKRIYLHNQRIGLIDSITEDIDKYFLYWFLRTSNYQKQIVGSASGTTVKHTSPNRICDIEISFPPLPTQKKIAEVLSCLDAKIELNRRINENLEQQAQAIFKEWFVDNAKPEWKVGKLGDIIEVKYGKDHKKLSEGAIPVFGSGGVMRYVDKSLYDKESVLIPRKGTLNNIIYLNEPFWSVDTMFYSQMKKANVAKFVYFYLKSLDLASMNAGSAVPSMTTEILNRLEFKMPDDLTLQKYDNITTSLFTGINKNNKESKTLVQIRDTLLPKLMSGELEV